MFDVTLTVFLKMFADMEFVQNFTLPKFLDKNFTPKKSVNHDIFKFASNSVNAF